MKLKLVIFAFLMGMAASLWAVDAPSPTFLASSDALHYVDAVVADSAAEVSAQADQNFDDLPNDAEEFAQLLFLPWHPTRLGSRRLRLILACHPNAFLPLLLRPPAAL
jgi:hypothetical protein